MKRKWVPLLAILLLTACSPLSTLTPDILNHAESQWNSAKPSSYRMVIEMSGDRVEKEKFEITVQAGQIKDFRRNGNVIMQLGQNYSMDGLFRMLHQELDLTQKPSLLGAPDGYSAYPMAQFDSRNGALIEYQRTVGGTSNTIHIKVLSLQAN